MNKEDKQLLKLQVKARKQQDKDFKRLYNKARKTIARLYGNKASKQDLIDDLAKCNNIEIIHYLGEIQPTTKAEYIFAINKLLEMESITHEYQYLMVYKPGGEEDIQTISGRECLVGGFSVLTENIRLHHKANDSLDNLRKKIGLKKKE